MGRNKSLNSQDVLVRTGQAKRIRGTDIRSKKSETTKWAS